MLISIFFWIVTFIVNLILSAFAISIVYKVPFKLKKAFFVVLVEIVMVLIMALVFLAVFGIAGLIGVV